MTDNTIIDFASMKKAASSGSNSITPRDVLEWFAEQMEDEEFAQNIDSVVLVVSQKDGRVSHYFSDIQLKDVLLIAKILEKTTLDNIFEE